MSAPNNTASPNWMELSQIGRKANETFPFKSINLTALHNAPCKQIHFLYQPKRGWRDLEKLGFIVVLFLFVFPNLKKKERN